MRKGMCRSTVLFPPPPLTTLRKLWFTGYKTVRVVSQVILKCRYYKHVTNEIYDRYPTILERLLPCLVMVGRFCGDDPRYWDFLSKWVPILSLITIWLTPLSANKNSLFLSHLVSGILGLKSCPIFHQNVLFDSF